MLGPNSTDKFRTFASKVGLTNASAINYAKVYVGPFIVDLGLSDKILPLSIATRLPHKRDKLTGLIAQENVMHLAELYVHPLKSGRGVRHGRAFAGQAGLLGDRSWMLTTPQGRFITAAATPCSPRCG